MAFVAGKGHKVTKASPRSKAMVRFVKKPRKGPHKVAKHVGAVTLQPKAVVHRSGLMSSVTIHKGIRELGALRAKVSAMKAMMADEKAVYFGKDSKSTFVLPDKKDLALATMCYDTVVKDVRAMARGLYVAVSLADVPAFIVSTAGGIAGQTLYFDDVQANQNFADWKTVFDTFRLCAVHTTTNFAGFNANVVSGNYSTWTFATDVDNVGSSSTGQTTPTMTTLAGYPYNGPTPTKTLQGALLSSKEGGGHTQMTSHRHVVQAIDGNDSTHTKVALGMWVNCTGNAVIVAGAHLSALFVGAVSVNVAQYWRRYDCEFTSGA